MKINTTCAGCAAVLFPLFYVEYYQNPRLDDKPIKQPKLKTNAVSFPTCQMLITHFDSRSKRFVMGQMYHIACFIELALENSAVLALPMLDKKTELTELLIRFPVYQVEHLQNFPRTHLKSAGQDSYAVDMLLQAIQREIELKRYHNLQANVNWKAREIAAIESWNKVLSVLKGNSNALPDSARTLFNDPNVKLIDLRLIRNIMVMALDTNPAPGTMELSSGAVLEGWHPA